ncbi:uncharacterized protein GGS22DRAFT_184771 [Annulohypoxylon maeteangense]|uniref:uncharacterized protein n=1 Tax=Annulohypoxylon maeteangense TaxID=1927788 RepID=UPI002008C546|nr:uncharacterized protein GGS22DRAFT_184771 [Annulohypoxylon maeteangense]KAI0889195.1 hypothetical protein GGS22DRAFT_184771 [Annulohypoxylon maeteangense]
MFLSPTKSNCQLTRRIDISSRGERNTTTAKNPAGANTACKLELSDGRGFLLISPSHQYKVDHVHGNSTEYRNLVGRYRTKAMGFWVIFLDGMRWYPRTCDEVIEVKFGPGTGHYVPRFINSQGDVLGSYMTASELSHGPLFSFIPRNRPVWDNHLTSSSFYDMPHVSSQSQVYIKDHREELMAIPNGRMMIWYAGSPESPPMHYWNSLRQCSQRVDTPDPLEQHPNARRAQKAEVPESIRKIAREIGNLV